MRRMVSSGSVKAFLIDRDRLLERLRSIAKELRESFKYVKDIYLFGSLAKGEERGLSDVDLLIAVEALPKERFWDIFNELYTFVWERLPIAFDIIITPEERLYENPQMFGKTLRL